MFHSLLLYFAAISLDPDPYRVKQNDWEKQLTFVFVCSSPGVTMGTATSAACGCLSADDDVREVFD